MGHTKSERITTLVTSIVEESFGKSEVKYSRTVQQAHDILREFMFTNVYYNKANASEKDKACHVIEGLFEYYFKKPEKMPELYLKIAEKDGIERAAADYISGMSDDYAVDLFKELFIPKPWVSF